MIVHHLHEVLKREEVLRVVTGFQQLITLFRVLILGCTVLDGITYYYPKICRIYASSTRNIILKAFWLVV